MTQIYKFPLQVGLELREKRKYYGGGWLKEQRIRFGGGSPFDNAFIKYQMDGTGRPAKVSFTAGSKRERAAPDTTWSYHQGWKLLSCGHCQELCQAGS